MATADIKLQHIDSLWSDYKQRMAENPELRIEQFATEHVKYADDIRRVFPLMLELESFGEHPADLESLAEIPEVIGRYPIIRLIGVGGMGIVYEADCQALRERIAIKVISAEKLSEKNIQRFRQEARSVAALHHTNIVPIYESGEDEEGNHFYTMRLIEGPNLSDVVHTARHHDGPDLSIDVPEDALATDLYERLRNNWQLIADLGAQAASALAHAHSKDILHRDIKPANLLIDAFNKLWVTDFGLAKRTLDDSSLTSMYQAVGTPRYMAPEQISGECDQRSDLFSLGLTLFELVTMQKITPDHRERLTKGDATAIRQHNCEVPAELERILLKACAARPDARYQSAAEMFRDLDTFANNRARQSQNHRRNKTLLGVVAACIIVSICVSQIPAFRQALAGSIGLGGPGSQSERQPKVFGIDEGETSIGTIPENLGNIDSLELTGPDASLFEFDRVHRQIRFVKPADFEVPLDSDMDNVYQVQLTSTIEKKERPTLVQVRVSDINEAPSFDEFVFEADGQTIIRSTDEMRRAWMIDVADDRDNMFGGLCMRLVGGDDRDMIMVTPQGVFIFNRQAYSEPASDANGDDIFEIEVAVSDASQPWIARLEEQNDGRIALVKERIVRGARLESKKLSEDCLIRRNVIDIASPDGQTFYHIHHDDAGTTSLLRSTLSASNVFVSEVLNEDCGIPQEAIALATADGETFFYAVRQRGYNQNVPLFKSTLGTDGTFVSTPISDRCELSSKIEGLSQLDSNRFHHIRRHPTGDSSLYFSWLNGNRFTNMQLNDAQPQYTSTTRGHAAWVEQGVASKTTTRMIHIRKVQ